MILIIVESPGKVKKIEQILGSNYKVVSSVGHIMDLDPRALSIDIKNNFNPIFIENLDKKDVINTIRFHARRAEDIILMTDGDREGENIAWCLAKILNLKNPKRVISYAIEKKPLLEGIKNPRQLDNNLINAQKTRRILDRLVGWDICPILDKQLGQKRLSAGRVQSVVARLIVDKENEVNEFFKGEQCSYFKFKGVFFSDNKQFNANLYDLENKNKNNNNKEGILKGNSSKIENKIKAELFLKNCKSSEFIVANTFDKKRYQNPSAPFTTSTLQQEGNKKLGFTSQRIMTAAQHLYEGGYITYMRTDSTNLSEEAMENIKKYVLEKYDENYYRKMEYKSKDKNAQEAHEACRPTDVFTEYLDENSNGKIGHDEIKLYSLIWKRTVASQMSQAEFNTTSIQIIISNDNNYFFQTNIENLQFAGYLVVYNVKNLEPEEEDNENNNLNIPKKGDKLKVKNITGTQDFNKPPSRYNEAMLIEKLEHLSIGRPATTATIIKKILEKEYVKIKDIDGKTFDSIVLNWEFGKEIETKSSKVTLGKEMKKFVPTYLGILVTNFLIHHFPKIMDYKFTAMMEDKLDQIANGELVWHETLSEFYNDFHPLIMSLWSKNSEFYNKTNKLLGVEPKSGQEMIATEAKFGPVVKLMQGDKKPIYAPIKSPLTLDNITYEDAVKLFEYPKILGKYDKKNIVMNRGEYGYYITFGNIKFSVEENITLEETINKIKEKKKNSIKEFKTSEKIYTILDGPYGKYVCLKDIKNKKKYNISFPKNVEINFDDLTLEELKKIMQNNYKKNNEDDKIKEIPQDNTNEKKNIKKKIVKKNK